MSESSSSRMAQALRENIGAYVWLEGDVLRLRTKSDSVVDAVTQVAVSIRKARGGGGTEVPLSNLSAVAMPKSFPGAAYGTAVPTDEATESDMVLVTDSPFDAVWAHVRESSPYFWRSSAAYDMFNRMTVVLTMMAFKDEAEQSKPMAAELVDLGRRVLEKEPAAEAPGFFYLLGTGHDELKNLDAAEAAFTRALELHAKRSELNDATVRAATRRLGLLLAMRGTQNDDMQAQRRALELLEKVPLGSDDPAHKLRSMLRDAVRRADEPAPATTKSSKRGCFIASAVYGSPLANEVITLCEFRDRILSRSPLGRGFIRFYYRASPPFAKHVGSNDGLRQVVRTWLIAPLLRMARKRLAKEWPDPGDLKGGDANVKDHVERPLH